MIELLEDENYMDLIWGQIKCLKILEYFGRNIKRINEATRINELEFQPGNSNLTSWTSPDYFYPVLPNYVVPEEHQEDFDRLSNLIDKCKETFDLVDKMRVKKLGEMKKAISNKEFKNKILFEDVFLMFSKKHPKYELVNSVVLKAGSGTMTIEMTYGITFKDSEEILYKSKFDCNYLLDDSEGLYMAADAIADGCHEDEEYEFKEGEIKIIGV